MQQNESVTHLIHMAQTGEESLVQQRLWNRYFDRLVKLARSRLSLVSCRKLDEEDIVLSVFDSVFNGFKEGKFPYLSDRNKLWGLLKTITIRKIFDHHKKTLPNAFRERRQSDSPNSDQDQMWIEQFVDKEPTPEEVAQFTGEVQICFKMLDRDYLKSVANMKLSGYTNREIAEHEGVIEETIERRLRVIRRMWGKRFGIETA